MGSMLQSQRLAPGAGDAARYEQSLFQSARSQSSPSDVSQLNALGDSTRQRDVHNIFQTSGPQHPADGDRLGKQEAAQQETSSSQSGVNVTQGVRQSHKSGGGNQMYNSSAQPAGITLSSISMSHKQGTFPNITDPSIIFEESESSYMASDPHASAKPEEPVFYSA